MDLERIKQSFRTRSGRTKKTRKADPATRLPNLSTPSVPVRTNSQQLETPRSTSKQEKEKATKVKEEKTEEEKEEKAEEVKEERGGEKRNFDVEKSPEENPEQRPSLPHASTEMNGAPIAPQNRLREIAQHSRYKTEKSTQKSVLPPIQRATSEPKMSSEESDVRDYDLRPPPRKPKPPSLENLSELLFSEGHLNTLLHDPQLLHLFTGFINRYKPDLAPILISYLETQKAVKAVEYANAVAAAVAPVPSSDNADRNIKPKTAAQIDETFAEASRAAFTSLVSNALPPYITYSLVRVVTECLTNEITGRSTPIMRDLVGGLSEIFCLTDPNQEDNPIIYASEEFYRLTGYEVDDVIGNNCRFLQGPKTRRDAPQRLREGQANEEQVCETLLNYRRDGRAFLNLLMTAPLHDDKQKLKYFIGAQVDVSRLVEDGKGLNSFSRYLTSRDKRERGRGRRKENDMNDKKQVALEKLRELSEMFDLEESAIVQSHSRASSMSRDDDSITSKDRPRTARRVIADTSNLGDEDEAGSADEEEKLAWSLATSGPSGKLPGIYERYMLIRPAPSLRIIFVSPKLRNIGEIVQSPFLSHIAASAKTLAGLKESFDNGVPVTAKIGFMPEAGKSRDGTETTDMNGKEKEQDEAVKSAKTCWISATPLLGGDEQIGVWVLVIVQKGKGLARNLDSKIASKSTEGLDSQVSNERRPSPRRRLTGDDSPKTPTPTQAPRPRFNPEDMPIKPKRIDSGAFVSPAPATPPAKPKEKRSNGDQEKPYEWTPRSEEDMNANARDLDLPDEGDREEVNDEDIFVRKQKTRSPQRKDRNVIPADNDEEEIRDDPATPTIGTDPTEGEYDAASRPNSPPDEDQTTIGNGSPPSARMDETPEPKEDWPKLHDLSSIPSSPLSSRDAGPESNSARPAGMLYMDYLRHPGSRGSALPRNGNNDDPDCAKTPYSLD